MKITPQLGAFLRQNWPIVSVLVAACTVALWFAVSILLDFIYFHDPRHQNEALKPWMTPRYVVMSYDLPRTVVAELLGLTSEDQRRMPMKDIAAMMGVTLEELTDIVRAGAKAHRAASQ